MARMKSVGYGSKVNQYGVRFTRKELEEYKRVRKKAYNKQRYLARKRLQFQNEKNITGTKIKETAERKYFEFNPPLKIQEIKTKKTFKKQIRATKIKLQRKVSIKLTTYKQNYIQSLRTVVKGSNISNKNALYRVINEIESKLMRMNEFESEEFFDDAPNIEYNYENEISTTLDLIWAML